MTKVTFSRPVAEYRAAMTYTFFSYIAYLVAFVIKSIRMVTDIQAATGSKDGSFTDSDKAKILQAAKQHV